MGLNEPNEILDAFANLFSKDSLFNIPTKKYSEELNMNEYFSSNTLQDGELSEDDLITISIKNKDSDGYTAKFVKLGDIVKFIKSKTRKSNK